MLSILFFTLLTFAQVIAKESPKSHSHDLQNSMENLVGNRRTNERLVNRLLEVWPRQGSKALDGTTVAKPALAASTHRAVLPRPPTLYRASQEPHAHLQCYTWSKSAHALRTIHAGATRTSTGIENAEDVPLAPGETPETTPVKEVKWPVAYRSLVDRGLQSVSGEEAIKMVEDDGAVICDVREEKYFARGTPEGAVHLPLYVPVQGNSFRDWNKRLQGLALGVQVTDRNTNFVSDANKMLPRDKPIIVICARGGLVDDAPFKDPAGVRKLRQESGRYTTSLKAAYELYEAAGFKNVYFVDGGISKWYSDDLPMEYYPE